MTEGTLTIGIEYYTLLIEEKAKADARLEALKVLVDADRYGLADEVRKLYGWKKPVKENAEA